MPICTWQEIAGHMCYKCRKPATHFVDEGPMCCQCHQKMGSHFLIPLFSPEDTKFAHEMVLKERRAANKYDD